jgi:hypothetical protein
VALFDAAGDSARKVAPLLADALDRDRMSPEPHRLQATARHFGAANLASRVFSRTLWASSPVPGAPEWTALYRLIPQNGAPVIAELRLVPTNDTEGGRAIADWRVDDSERRNCVPMGGLTWKIVRSIALGSDLIASKKVMNKLETRYGSELYQPSGLFGRHGFDEAPGAITRAAKQRAPGRAGRPEIYYAELARDYVHAREVGPRNPIALLSDTRGIKRDQVRDMVRRARELGLLTVGLHGRPSGVLTDKAKQLLRSSRKATKRRA